VSPSNEVAVREDAAEAILAQQQGEFTPGDVNVPIMKVGQALTREVEEGSADAGEFINSLTGEGIGKNVGFIIAYYAKGRAGSEGPGERYYTSNDPDIIPAHWADFVGEAFVGTRFDEYPDAEETFKERVNAKEIEWGKGPKISTTHNYTGLVLVSPTEDEDEDPEPMPVRLSLKRTDMSAVRAINDLFRYKMRNQPFWARVFDLSTVKKTGKGTYYNVAAKLGRETTDIEREMALDLAMAVTAGRVQDNSDTSNPDEKVAPKAEGALGI
jgi:hypothetical protein